MQAQQRISFSSLPPTARKSQLLAPLALPQRRVVLVDLYWGRNKDPRVALGHASLLAALHHDAALDVHSVARAVNDIPLEHTAQLATEILRQTIGWPATAVDVAIGAYVWNEDHVQALLPLLRAQGFQGRIIVGGPQISYVDSGLEELYPDANVFIRGHGETALREVARSNHHTAVHGAHYAGAVDCGEQANAMSDAWPSPWLNELIVLKDQGFMRWETQRGCRFKCSFCQHRLPDARLKCVAFPRKRIMDEIDLICSMGVKEIAVLDPVFNSNADAGHGIAVLKRFTEKGFNGRLSLQCRAELVTAPFLDAAQALDVCLEFGLQTIHKQEYDAIERPNNIAKVEKILAEVRARGIRHEVSLIFGLPTQTLASFTESVQWCIEQKVPTIKAFPLLLLRGTKLAQQAGRWNLRVDDGPMGQVVGSDTFSREDWQTMERISQALRDTEQQHPAMAELIQLAETCEPDAARWQPVRKGQQ